ncbi:Fic family protein [Candidatus Parcubacteria bacterium]|nr:Fic family protein [Candidatus Parcubacteria bacterium]
MRIEIGKNIKQTRGFEAFVLNPFPPDGLFDFPQTILLKTAEAGRLMGKLDGITHTLPDVDFFLSMFVAKDAASSAQIEGTKATIVDAIEKNVGMATKETDVDDILYYIKALHYGIKRLNNFPLSLRLTREIHSQLMTGARASHFSDPGEFRKSQNWIGGTTPANALFVPPPVDEMKNALNDFEKFLHDEQNVLPLIHIGLAHTQFETMHPFLDGNGRTGRLLISILLCHRNILERPVLFLSSYFKKHQKIYYQKIDDYHNGDIDSWMDFFLDGIIETANDSIFISKSITKLREKDMAKIQALAKRESQSGILVLQKLYRQPVVSTKIIMAWTKFSRIGSQKLIDRFVNLGILEQRDEKETYDKTYLYKKYIDIFL